MNTTSTPTHDVVDATPPSTGTSDRPARLMRSRQDRVIAGVAGGLGHYLGVDPVLIRIGFVVLTIAGGSGLLAYVVAWIIVPEDQDDGTASATTRAPDPVTMRLAAGGLLVLVGGSWLLNQLVPELGRVAWPVALIVVGLAVIVTGARR